MNKYETIIIMDNKITEEQRNTVISRVRDYILANGEITKEQDLGEKKLAYEVRKCQRGYYYLIKFNAKSTSIAELERIYRITDEIIKFIVVREN